MFFRLVSSAQFHHCALVPAWLWLCVCQVISPVNDLIAALLPFPPVVQVSSLGRLWPGLETSVRRRRWQPRWSSTAANVFQGLCVCIIGSSWGGIFSFFFSFLSPDFLLVGCVGELRRSRKQPGSLPALHKGSKTQGVPATLAFHTD